MPEKVSDLGTEICRVYVGASKKAWMHMHFDLKNWRLSMTGADEQPVVCNLGRAEVRVLYRLMSKPGEVFSKEQLVMFGWPGRVVTIGSLTQAIFNIRSFFGAEGHGIIVTNPKAGYMFNPDFVAVSVDNEEKSFKQFSDIVYKDVSSIPSKEYLTMSILGMLKNTNVPGWSVLAVFCLILLTVFYAVRAESELLMKDQLRVSSVRVGGFDIDFITSIKKDIAADLKSQIKSLPLDSSGKILIRVHGKRFRVVCYTAAGSSSVAAPLNSPLKDIVAQCLSRAGEVGGGH